MSAISFLGRYVDFIAAVIVVLVWFSHDQGWVAIGDAPSDAPIRIGSNTIAAAAFAVTTLRGVIESKLKRKALPEADGE